MGKLVDVALNRGHESLGPRGVAESTERDARSGEGMTNALS